MGCVPAARRAPVTGIHTFSNSEIAFDPEVTEAMGAAFDEVCRALLVPDNAKVVRDAIAEKSSNMRGAGNAIPPGYGTRS
jgi:hypothetical protein